VTCPHLAKNDFISYSVALYANFLTKTSNDPYYPPVAYGASLTSSSSSSILLCYAAGFFPFNAFASFFVLGASSLSEASSTSIFSVFFALAFGAYFPPANFLLAL